MNEPISSAEAAKPKKTPGSLSTALERGTAVAVWAVVLSLAWMISAAYHPDYFRPLALEAEVIIMLALLGTALLLVSVIALRHTRSVEGEEEEPSAHGSGPPG